MKTLTNFETLYMLELEREAFGGLIFTGDINVQGMDKAQKSGVVSSLCQKEILIIGEDGMIGLRGDDDGYGMDANWEPSRKAVSNAVETYLAS